MQIEYDQVKNRINIENRGLSFELIRGFELESALVRMDLRKDYGELRFNMLGFIEGEEGRLFHVVCTLRGDSVRIISFRKANRREVKYYVNNQ